jgi:hypothetical protein
LNLVENLQILLNCDLVYDEAWRRYPGRIEIGETPAISAGGLG